MKQWKVTGHCVMCGSPIWSDMAMEHDEVSVPTTVKSCGCVVPGSAPWYTTAPTLTGNNWGSTAVGGSATTTRPTE